MVRGTIVAVLGGRGRLAWAPALAVVAGCGEPGESAPPPEPWRGCDVAYDALAVTPPLAAQAPLSRIEVGDALPTFRIDRVEHDAESLANHILATACAMTQAQVVAYPDLVTWADARLADDASVSIDGPLFEPAIGASFFVLDGEAAVIGVDVAVRSPAPEVEPGQFDEGVGEAAALAVAEAAFNDLVNAGVVANVEHERVLSWAGQATDCTKGGECMGYVHTYGFRFAPRLAGVRVAGTWVDVEVDRTGVLLGVTQVPVTVASASNVVAAVSEADAQRRYDQGLAQAYPGAELLDEVTPAVTYRVPSVGDNAEVEPTWWGVIVTRTDSGVVGRPQSAWVSLTDVDANVVQD